MRMKLIKKRCSLILLVSILFQMCGFPIYAQDGYQQPVLPERGAGSLYDEALKQGSEPVYEPPPQAQRFDQGFQDPGQLGTSQRPLKGRVVVVPSGTIFETSLVTTLSSGINRVGDRVIATVATPVIVGRDVVIPSGSQVLGQVTRAVPASRFKAGAGGELEIRFTTLVTPDGSTYPISGSIDESQFQLSAETGGSRVAKGVTKTAVGAGVGAALGTALGAIAGGKKGVGKGAWSGAAIGGGLGALSALAGKGKELVLQAGINIPIRLDTSVNAVVPQR